MRDMTSTKASLKAGLVCWDGAGWHRKRGTGCVWEMEAVEVVVWMLKRKRARAVVGVEEAAMVVQLCFCEGGESCGCLTDVVRW